MLYFFPNNHKNASVPEEKSVTEIIPTVQPITQSPTEAEEDVSVETTPEATTQRTRQGRQQSGDTYTLEIAFPAIKYVHLTPKKNRVSLNTFPSS